MTANFVHILSGDAARSLQQQAGSRGAYAAMETRATAQPDRLGEREAAFIAARDSFYMASVSADGWPYVQHRGGPPGFLRVIDEGRIGFADYSGNRQYMSAGNLALNDRVALFLMDYPGRRRLKLIGHARRIGRVENPGLVDALMPAGYAATPEGALLIDVVAFDWNCPQHITPRWTADEIIRMKENEAWTEQ